MNFYHHHIGDYASATQHLSVLEDCFYRRLLDWYYLDEKPIPTDRRTVCRRLRAVSESEQEAVDIVLAEFFVLTDEGYRNAACDVEIAKTNSIKQKAAQSAKARWGNAKAMRTHSEGSADAVPPHSEGNAPTPTPTPTPKEKIKAMSGRPDATELLEYLNAKAGRAFKPVDANLKPLEARLKDFSKADIKAVIDDRVGRWRNDEKMSEYLRPDTLFNATKFAQYNGSLGFSPQDDRFAGAK